MKIFKIFDVLTGSPRVPGQNKNHTLSPTDFGMRQTRTFVAQRCFENFTFDVSSTEIYVFKPFWPRETFQRKANWVGGCFFHAELRDQLFPEFSHKLESLGRATCAASLWRHLRLVELDSWNKLYFCLYRIWNMKPQWVSLSSDSTGNISWLQPPSPPSRPHYPSVLQCSDTQKFIRMSLVIIVDWSNLSHKYY